MAERLKIPYPIIVEGKYDKNKLSQILDATIITTGGFSVFNSKEKLRFFKKLAERGGVILLTDSDAGGDQIRRFLSGALPKERIFNLYIPRIEGKEKRKTKMSKSGVLGVEGMSREVIERLFAPFVKSGGVSNNDKSKTSKMITKVDFFEDGLSGGASSAEKRAILAQHFELPETLTATALLEALNLLVGYDDYKDAVTKLFFEEPSL